MHEIIERFVENDSNTCERLRSLMKEDGRGIDDQLMVSLLAKRLQAKDCLQNGYIIEDFPRTRA
jgi:adenylate kinase family enzyme